VTKPCISAVTPFIFLFVDSYQTAAARHGRLYAALPLLATQQRLEARD
jgi:hypothetical protein